MVMRAPILPLPPIIPSRPPFPLWPPSQCVPSRSRCLTLTNMFSCSQAAMDEWQFSQAYWDGSSEAQRRYAHTFFSNSMLTAQTTTARQFDSSGRCIAIVRIPQYVHAHAVHSSLRLRCSIPSRFRFFVCHGNTVHQSRRILPPDPLRFREMRVMRYLNVMLTEPRGRPETPTRQDALTLRTPMWPPCKRNCRKLGKNSQAHGVTLR
jgi:hypothetical protein